jgi:hypothetical protein
MEQLYIYEKIDCPELGNIPLENYLGDIYCKKVITDLLKNLPPNDWVEQKYLGSQYRIANETFIILSSSGIYYNISFAINTYDGKAARLEVTITAPETADYDNRLEKLKIELKNRLLADWCQCTWLADEQASVLCKTAFEKTYEIENQLRAFASKVLIHFLGVDWIKKAGLEKEAESVNTLKEKFIQRVADFDNINTDFLSMTLETLVSVIFNGVVYKDDVILNRQEYAKIQAMGQKTTGNNIANYIKTQRTIDKHIWDELFIPYIDDPSSFKAAIHNFIEDRNHVAHSKILSWNAYKVILQDFEKIQSLIISAETKFEQDETADEVVLSWQADYDADEYEKEHFRDLLAIETGMDILNEENINTWFDKILHELFNFIYQQYHFDVCYEISKFTTIDESGVIFSISCPVNEDKSIRIDIIAEYSINDDLGEDSICHIVAKSGNGEEICKAEIKFHNGNGYVGDFGIMEISDDSIYDTSELDDFKNNLLTAIASLNPYFAKLDILSYESKGAVNFVSDYPCIQCGNLGVSINETFLNIGKCCYCGYKNELKECVRCGEMINIDNLDNGLCPSCVVYVDEQ